MLRFDKNPQITEYTRQNITNNLDVRVLQPAYSRLVQILTEKALSDDEQNRINQFVCKPDYAALLQYLDEKAKHEARMKALRTSARNVMLFLRAAVVILLWVVAGGYLGVNAIVGLIPVVSGLMGRIVGGTARVSAWSLSAGVVLACVLYRYVFREAFAVLWACAVQIAKYLLVALKGMTGAVLVVLQDLWAAVCKSVGGCIEWLKSLLVQYGYPVNARQGLEDCMLAVCNLTKTVLHYGGAITVHKLIAVAVTVLIALNATHEFVDANGTRLVILPKEDFASLPTLGEQQFRIARNAPAGPRMEIPKEKTSFQENAEFIVEQQKKKPAAEEPASPPQDQDAAGNSWYFELGVWGVKAVAEHTVMFLGRKGLQKFWNWAFGEHVAKVFSPYIQFAVSTAVGAAVAQTVEHSSPAVSSIIVAAVGGIFYKVAGWIVDQAVNALFGAATAKVDENPHPISAAGRAAENRVGNPPAGAGRT
jgi:hypothetical protein